VACTRAGGTAHLPLNRMAPLKSATASRKATTAAAPSSADIRQEIAEIAEGECWVESVACSLSLLSRRLVRTPPCCALAARRLPASGVLGELGARGLELLRT